MTIRLTEKTIVDSLLDHGLLVFLIEAAVINIRNHGAERRRHDVRRIATCRANICPGQRGQHGVAGAIDKGFGRDIALAFHVARDNAVDLCRLFIHVHVDHPREVANLDARFPAQPVEQPFQSFGVEAHDIQHSAPFNICYRFRSNLLVFI